MGRGGGLFIATKGWGEAGDTSTAIGHEGPQKEWTYSSTLSLTSTLDKVGGPRQAPAALPPGNTAGTRTRLSGH